MNSPLLLKGRTVREGIAEAPARYFSTLRLADLHDKGFQDKLDLQLKDMLGNPDLPANFSAGLNAGAPNPHVEASFWDAVKQMREHYQYSVLFSVASVIERQIETHALRTRGGAQVGSQELLELGKRVLSKLLELRQVESAPSEGYVAVVPSLKIAEAIGLEPRLVGLAIGRGIDSRVRVAADVLGVPAIIGLEDLERVGPRFRHVKLDGKEGTLVENPGIPPSHG
jgi:hypothetical protein